MKNLVSPPPALPLQGYTHCTTQMLLDPNTTPGTVQWAYFYKHDITGTPLSLRSPRYELLCDKKGTRLGRRL